MNPPSTVALILFCAVFNFGYRPARAAAPFAKVIMTTGSISEREGAVYVAQEHGFFRKYGVDVLVRAGAQRSGWHGGTQLG